MTPADKIAQLRACADALEARDLYDPSFARGFRLVAGILADLTAAPVAPVESGEPSAGNVGYTGFAVCKACGAMYRITLGCLACHPGFQASAAPPPAEPKARCTCGSGGHPRHCAAHPNAFAAHVAEMDRANDADNALVERAEKAEQRLAALREGLTKALRSDEPWRSDADLMQLAAVTTHGHAAVGEANDALRATCKALTDDHDRLTTEAAELRARVAALEGAVRTAKACCDKASRLNIGSSAYIAANCEASIAIDTAAALAGGG